MTKKQVQRAPNGGNLKTTVKQIAAKLTSGFARHPYVFTLVLLAAYLVLFQWRFVVSGDTWAEAFYEYVHGAVSNGAQGFFHTGIAGYYNFIPKLFSYPYVLLGLPLTYIDHYFRIVVILYTIGCIAFIAHDYNRHLIKNDYLRALMALMVLLSYYHISSFSFINVWYVGFIPIILVSLHPHRFRSEIHEVLYAIFAASVCLTKPSLIVLPLILYRMIRHKEYLLGSILVFAVGLQSLLFLTSSYYATFSVHTHVGLLHKVINVLLYTGLAALKLFRWFNAGIVAIGAAVVVLTAIAVYVIRVRGLIQTALLVLTLLLAVYTAIYSPDMYPISVSQSHHVLLLDQMKLQRELMISFFVLLLLFLASNDVIDRFHNRAGLRGFVPTATIVLLLVLTGFEFRLIDTVSSKLYINIDSFRTSLRTNQPICMPIAPTPGWVPVDFPGGPTYGWYYENGAYGSCQKHNYDKAIDYTSFSHTIGRGSQLVVADEPNNKLNSLLLPVYNPSPDTAHTVILEDTLTHKTYTSVIVSKSSNDHLSFVAFNLSGETSQPAYNLRIMEASVTASPLRIGEFTDHTPAFFPYFLP